jgi:hypothetical protein
MRSCLALFAAVAIGACGGGMGDDEPGGDGGGGGGDGNDVEPSFIPGGGVSSGAIDGEVNVFVADDGDQPIAGAAVRVGDASASTPLEGMTDGNGLIVFQSDDLAGAQMITATAPGKAAATFVGANGANVTLILEPNPRPAVQTATVRGTIQGWDSLPAPGLTEYNVAVIQYSFTPEFGAPENSIEQPPDGDLTKNICVRTAFDNAGCNWEMTVRTGEQIHYAVLARGEQDSEDFELLGYAVKTGLNISSGEVINNETLTMVSGNDLVDINVTVPNGPAGMSQATAFPFLDMGAAGHMVFPLPTLNPSNSSTTVIGKTGEFASGDYLMVGVAVAPGQDYPYSTSYLRGLSFDSTVAVGSWMGSASGISGSARSYSFTAASGAAFHVASLVTSSDDIAWSVYVLDGSTSFELPTMASDPLSGVNEMRVAAFDLPGFSAGDFDLANRNDTMARVSEASGSVSP